MWQINQTTQTDEEGNNITTYGVTHGDSIFPDISADRKLVEDFVEKLNQFNASVIHAYDLIEDLLAQ